MRLVTRKMKTEQLLQLKCAADVVCWLLTIPCSINLDKRMVSTRELLNWAMKIDTTERFTKEQQSPLQNGFKGNVVE